MINTTIKTESITGVFPYRIEPPAYQAITITAPLLCEFFVSNGTIELTLKGPKTNVLKGVQQLVDAGLLILGNGRLTENGIEFPQEQP